MSELVAVGLSGSVTTMSEAYWEMERRRMMGSRARAIETYAALEFPRESLAAVIRMTDAARSGKDPRNEVVDHRQGGRRVGSPSTGV
jgi:hypothetical protein